jgi:hypothetical protein
MLTVSPLEGHSVKVRLGIDVRLLYIEEMNFGKECDGKEMRITKEMQITLLALQ